MRIRHYLKFKSFCLIFIFLFLPLLTQAAILYVSPQNRSVHQGDTFIVDVKLNTEGKNINVVNTHLKFSSSLMVKKFIKGNSPLTIFITKPKIKNEEISFSGGCPNGFNGDKLLARIIFLARSIGKGDISFASDSSVFLNDGRGTLGQVRYKNGRYMIIRKQKDLPIITSKTHPDQNKWYKNRIVQLHWNLVDGAKYSWTLSRNELSEPDNIADKPKPKKGIDFWMGAMEYNLTKEGDGIYYFSLRQKLPNQNWSKQVSRFRIMIDSTPPEIFEPRIGKDKSVFGGRYFLSFFTKDKMSGIDHYEVSEIPYLSLNKTDRWKTEKSPYLLKHQIMGDIIKVKAVDMAGNERIVEIKPFHKIKWMIKIFLLIVLVVIIFFWIAAKRFLKQRNIG